ncbi:CgeB family protein [Paenibacillus xerothermodurans]|uniref:Spore maturation protein cgeB n=1 Tax=Paenibacillus xerothermodurans TaxID=1977292 RepID=A0A2W1NAA6_PAEXE|nr:glycosyltransferase [Paenibacillus xerothermodurans]PZE20610.1 spore maturation protein cgeB [Paenibacillus xerothermodurans]
MAAETARKSHGHRSAQKAWKRGWKAGYGLGANYGYHLGRCEAVIKQTPPPPAPCWDARILYVTSGKPMPYPPLEMSVGQALSGMVREVITVGPDADIAAVAEQHMPDAVLVLEGFYVAAEQLERVRALGIRTAIWLTDDPYYTNVTINLVKNYDYVFTLELACVSLYQQHGCPRVFYLPFAANPAVFTPKPVPVHYRRDINFLGSAYWHRVAFFNRMTRFLAARNTYISGLWWDRLPEYHLLAHKISLNHWLEPEETAGYYNGAKVVINLHRAVYDPTMNDNTELIAAVSPNPRTFEICACGTLQLVDVRSDLSRFYTPGVEIVTYASADELMEKIDYYLQHEEERQEIALNALRRTRMEHTYQHRLAQLLQTFLG